MLGCPDCERYERLIAAQKVMLERQAREWERMMEERSQESERRSAAGRKAIAARWAKQRNTNV